MLCGLLWLSFPDFTPRGKLCCRKIQFDTFSCCEERGLAVVMLSWGLPGGQKSRENPTAGKQGLAWRGENKQHGSPRWKLPLKPATQRFRASVSSVRRGFVLLRCPGRHFCTHTVWVPLGAPECCLTNGPSLPRGLLSTSSGTDGCPLRTHSSF